ncbi:MAG TPA: hypothetical protein VLA36_02550 [Longimicrobiales bacterium]|nr:hypothetical protein [Longimicrobiales bacterium]
MSSIRLSYGRVTGRRGGYPGATGGPTFFALTVIAAGASISDIDEL